MSRRFIGAALLTAAVLALPWHVSNPALAQDKKKDAVKADTIDSDKFPAGEQVGILKTTPGSDRMFNLECQQDRLVPTGKVAGNPNAPTPRMRAPNMNRVNSAQQKIVTAMQHGQQAQAQLASAKNAKDQQKAQTSLNKAQGELTKAQGDYQTAVLQVIAQSNAQSNVMMLAAIRKYKIGMPTGYRVDKVKSLVEFQGSETVKVRTMVLPEEFDDKGKPKKYTKEELATLKGKDTNLPGYESSLEKLETGQKLRVVYSPKKKPAAKPKDKDADPDKDVVEPKDKEKDPTEKKTHVKMIVILEEAPSTTTSPGDKKK
jgi:hypothetical protein